MLESEQWVQLLLKFFPCLGPIGIELPTAIPGLTQFSNRPLQISKDSLGLKLLPHQRL